MDDEEDFDNGGLYPIEVRFRKGGKTYTYLVPSDTDVCVGDTIRVDTQFGKKNAIVARISSSYERTCRGLSTNQYKTYGENKTPNKENTVLNMQNFQEKMVSRFFRRVDNVVWDMMSGKVGIVGAEGIMTLDGEGEDATVNINLMDQFGMPLPAFAQQTAVADLKSGDLVYTNGKPKGWIIEVKEQEDKATRFSVISPTGTVSNWKPPKVTMLGFDSGVMVLKSLDALLGAGGKDGNEALAGMQGMLMPMMMMGGGDMEDMESMMPMLLMSQMGQLGEGAGGNMIQMMMMVKMMGGKGRGGNGFFD